MRFFHLSSRADGFKRLQNLLRDLELAGHTMTACRAVHRLAADAADGGIDATIRSAHTAAKIFRTASELCASADAVLFFRPATPSVACGIGMAWSSGVPVFAIGCGAMAEPFFINQCISRSFPTSAAFMAFLDSPDGAPSNWGVFNCRSTK